MGQDTFASLAFLVCILLDWDWDWDKFIQHNMTLYRCMISDIHDSSYVLFRTNLISNTRLHVGRPLLRPCLVAYAEATLARQKDSATNEKCWHHFRILIVDKWSVVWNECKNREFLMTGWKSLINGFSGEKTDLCKSTSLWQMLSFSVVVYPLWFEVGELQPHICDVLVCLLLSEISLISIGFEYVIVPTGNIKMQALTLTAVREIAAEVRARMLNGFPQNIVVVITYPCYHISYSLLEICASKHVFYGRSTVTTCPSWPRLRDLQ